MLRSRINALRPHLGAALVGLCVGALWACGGGPRKPGGTPGDVVYWRIVSSSVAFNQCSDSPEFRSQVQPLDVDAGTYLIYRIEKDGKKATSLDCTSFDPSSCTASKSGVVFDVAGSQLFFAKDYKTPLGDAGCNLLEAQNWQLTDKGTTMDLSIGSVLGYDQPDGGCAPYEESLKARSPNGTGVQGCQITYQVGGSID